MSVWAQYCIRVADRAHVQSALKAAGIPTAVFDPRPLHLQEAFADLGGKPGDFPVAEAVAGDIMALPMHPYMDEETQETVIAAVQSATRP